MLKCDGGEAESQTCAKDNQQDTANRAIPAMAAGRTAPEYGVPCFRLMGQLLPTFEVWSGGDRMALCTMDAVPVPLPVL